MVEIRRGSEGFVGGGERLPWLEPVEDEDGADYGLGGAPAGYGGVLLAAIGVLIGIAVLTAAVVWWRHHRAATADIGQVIRAPADPYKVRPADPGGMKPDRNGEVTYGTSTGQDINSPLDLSALPEAPVARRAPASSAPTPTPTPMPTPTATPTPAPAPSAPAPRPAVPAPAALKPAPPAKPVTAPATKAPVAAVAEPSAPPAGPSGTIQLGAFSSEAKANAAWKALAGRFTYIRDLEKAVVPVEADGKTLYRLRATGAGAPGLCARLRIAGETCAGV